MNTVANGWPPLTRKLLEDLARRYYKPLLSFFRKRTHNAPESRPEPTSDDEKAKRSFSVGFRVAQVDQGASASAYSVDSNGAADASSASLEQIVVTAARLSVDVMHAAVALTAINGDTLQVNEIHQVNDLQFYVPGLSFTNSPSGPALNVRGVGLTFSSPNIAWGVPRTGRSKPSC